MKPAFKVVHDATRRAAAAYGVTAIPANYVIGRDGKMLAIVGFDLPGLQQAAARAVGRRHGAGRPIIRSGLDFEEKRQRPGNDSPGAF